MKKIVLLLISSFISVAALAQDFPYGELDVQTLDMKKYDKDTSAHAVVLNEFGSARIIINNLDHIRLAYLFHTRIKFFDNKEFENEGTIEIPIYNDGDVYEDVTDIQGVTYSKDDNGFLKKLELDPKKIFKEKRDKHWTVLKFAMPGLKPGCIIEVKYRLETPYFRNFHSWLFQGDIPKMYSEYDIHIPGFWNFNASIRGYLKLTTNKSDIDPACFTWGSAKADCSHLTFGIKDIPAFVKEDYMTSPKNFMSGIYFELIEETNLNTGARVKYSKEWRDIDYDLKTSPWFGAQLKRKDLMKERIAPAIAGKTDSMEKAKAIYAYIQKNFKWNEDNDFGSNDGIRMALDNHTGNTADINLALIAALNSANIPTEAVLLSTRTHGSINTLYPGISDFNYVIAKANIGGKSYLLDATDPLLPFGILPMRCLNDKGRVFSLNKPSYWVDLSETKQRENTTFTYDLTLQDNGKLKGTMIRYSSGYSGYLVRKEIKKFNSVDEYVENMAGKFHKIKILKSDIVNIDSLDMPLGETYEVEIDAYDNLNHDRLAFDPFIMNKITTNPFKLAERDYPVDWGMPSDVRYVLTVHLPQQYTIENPPQEVAFTMPNQGGKFFIDFQSNNNTFVFSHVTQFNKSVYGTNEYPYLKELYNKIILSEKNELVFKKKS